MRKDRYSRLVRVDYIRLCVRNEVEVRACMVLSIKYINLTNRKCIFISTYVRIYVTHGYLCGLNFERRLCISDTTIIVMMRRTVRRWNVEFMQSCGAYVTY